MKLLEIKLELDINKEKRVMFSGFNLILNEKDFEFFSKDFDYYKNIGEKHLNEKKFHLRMK